MRTFRSSIVIALIALLSWFQSACTVAQVDNGFEARLGVPGFQIRLGVTFNIHGERVFVAVNPSTANYCIQPRDSGGNKIGGPIEFPSGSFVELPAQTDATKTELIEKPKTKPQSEMIELHPILNARRRLGDQQQAAAFAPPFALIRWPGLITSVTGSTTSISEYSIAARDASQAFAILDQIIAGTVPNAADLVCHTEFGPLSGSIWMLTITMPASDLAAFDVYIDGVLSASTTSGLGGASIVGSTNGYAQGKAAFKFDPSAASGEITVVSTDQIGATATRFFSFKQ